MWCASSKIAPKLVFKNLSIATAGELAAEAALMCTHANARMASASVAAGQTCVGQHGLAMNVAQRGRHEARLPVSVCPHANEATIGGGNTGTFDAEIWDQDHLDYSFTRDSMAKYLHTHEQATQTHTRQDRPFLMDKAKKQTNLGKVSPSSVYPPHDQNKDFEMSKKDAYLLSLRFCLKFIRLHLGSTSFTDTDKTKQQSIRIAGLSFRNGVQMSELR